MIFPGNVEQDRENSDGDDVGQDGVLEHVDRFVVFANGEEPFHAHRNRRPNRPGQHDLMRHK